MATPAQARWRRWPLIAALVLGVLAMHHLPDVPGLAGHAGATMAMPPATHLVSESTPRPVIEAGGDEGCTGMDMMGHMCLAVLDSAHTSPAPAPAVLSLNPRCGIRR